MVSDTVIGRLSDAIAHDAVTPTQLKGYPVVAAFSLTSDWDRSYATVQVSPAS